MPILGNVLTIVADEIQKKKFQIEIIRFQCDFILKEALRV